MVAQLRKQKPAAVADLGIIGPELVAVVAQRERRIEIVGERLEPAEMGNPLLVVQFVQSDRSFRNRRIWSGKSAAVTGSPISSPRRVIWTSGR